jgi:hypothetical protein
VQCSAVQCSEQCSEHYAKSFLGDDFFPIVAGFKPMLALLGLHYSLCEYVCMFVSPD